MNNGSNLKFAYRDQIVGLVKATGGKWSECDPTISSFRTLEVHGTHTDMTCR